MSKVIQHKNKLSRLGIFILITLIIGCLSFYSDKFLEALLPVMKMELNVIYGRYYEVSQLVLTEWNNDLDLSFSLDLTTKPGLEINGIKIPSGGSVSSATLAGHARQHLLIISLIAWCGVMAGLPLIKHRLLMLTLAAIVISILLDIPFVLAGAAETILYSNTLPGSESKLFVFQWMNIMNSGGRFGLAALFGCFAIKLSMKK